MSDRWIKTDFFEPKIYIFTEHTQFKQGYHLQELYFSTSIVSISHLVLFLCILTLYPHLNLKCHPKVNEGKVKDT